MRYEFSVRDCLDGAARLIEEHDIKLGVAILVEDDEKHEFGFGLSVVRSSVRPFVRALRSAVGLSSRQSASVFIGRKGYSDNDMVGLDDAFLIAKTAHHEIRHLYQHFNKNMPSGELGMAIRFASAIVTISPLYYGLQLDDNGVPVYGRNYWNDVCELDAELYSWEQMPGWLSEQGMPDDEIRSYCCNKMNEFFPVDADFDNYIHPDEPFESFEDGLVCLREVRDKAVHARKVYDYKKDDSAFGMILNHKDRDRRRPLASIGESIRDERDGFAAMTKILGFVYYGCPRIAEQYHFSSDDVELLSNPDLFTFDMNDVPMQLFQPLEKVLVNRFGHVDVRQQRLSGLESVVCDVEDVVDKEFS